MQLVLAPDAVALDAWAADWMLSHARGRLALAVGRSVEGTYRELARRTGCLAGRDVMTIDELHRLDPGDPRAFAAQLGEQLHGAGATVSGFDCAAADPDVEARRVDLAARDTGLAAVVLGLGPNGHLALDEPGQPFEAPARFVPFAPLTLAHLGGPDAVAPATGGMTLPLSTLLAADAVLLVVQGEYKRDALRRLLFGPLTTDLPASVLRLHGRAQLVTTPSCLGDLADDVLALPGVELLATTPVAVTA